MKKILVGVALGILGVFLSGYLVLISGFLPVATKGPPLPLEEWVTHQALKAALKGHTDVTPAIAADELNLVAGAKSYLKNCAVCHGIPEHKPSSIAQGLFPPPPQFFEKDQGVADDEPGKIFWFIKNGIRLTGMPGFVDTLSEKEIWQLSLFLKNGEELLPAVRKTLLEGAQ